MRWDIHRYLLEQEIAAISTRLAAAETTKSLLTATERAHLRLRLEALQARLRQMGPSPHAKMG
jgi:hypothetical protein